MSSINSAPSANALPPQVVFMQMINGYWVSQSIYVAAKLGIADQLHDGPKSCEEISSLTGADRRSLYRLLRGLASIGVFAETEPDYFSLTPFAQFLRSDTPDSLQAVAVMSGEEHYRAWGDLLYSVKTGDNAFEQVYGMPIFPYYSQNPESAKIFDRAMTGYSSTEIEAVVASYDFSEIHTLVDVAGGHGSLLISILQKNPGLHGILFDLATVIEGAHALIQAGGVGDRCNLSAGDFFESVPKGGDAYILKHIVHDWGDEQAIAILKRCREVIPDAGKILIVEQVIPPGNEPFMGKFLDLNMLVMCPGGCERTEVEYRAILLQAGFKLSKIVPTQTFASVIEGVPI